MNDVLWMIRELENLKCYNLTIKEAEHAKTFLDIDNSYHYNGSMMEEEYLNSVRNNKLEELRARHITYAELEELLKNLKFRMDR